MPDSNHRDVKLGPDGPIQNYEDLVELSLDSINLQRQIIARAVTAGQDRIVAVDLKRLKSLVDTHHTLLNSPQAKNQPKKPQGPSFVEKLIRDALEGPPPKPRKKN